MSDPRFAELLEKYWAIAYQQGTEGRNHDDMNGSAEYAELMLTEYVDRLTRELAEARALAYAETTNGPRLWKDAWQDAVDDAEWHRSSLNPQWEEVRRDATDKAREEAAKVARTWLEDWGCDLQHTADEYREAIRTGRFANRRIDAGQAKLYASQFQERADAVYDCGKLVHDTIRALKEKP